MKLEICANSYQSAKNAQTGGADRIELCSELSIGGITPSYGLIKNVLNKLNIETFVLIRPRSGNFIYSDIEFEIMKQNIEVCKTLGCHGIVSGILNKDNTLNIERTKALVMLSKPLPFTFHRAFDCVPNPLETMEQLIDLGVERILTSGQSESAKSGIEILKTLKQKAKQRIKILPGGGIRSENISLFKENGFKEIHSSAAKLISNNENDSYFGKIPQTVSDVETIITMLKQIK